MLVGLDSREVVPQRVEGQRLLAVVPEGTAESAPALGEPEALERGVQVRSTPGCGATRIGYDGRAVRVLTEYHS